jgi:hypothetical protein
MNKVIMKNYFEFKDYLGIQYPFYDSANPKKISLDITELLSREKEYTLDIQTVIEISMRMYPLTTRTLFKEIKRYPYIAEYNEISNDFNYLFSLKFSNNGTSDENEATKKLMDLLVEEVITFISNYKKVGILLSGGMDSRVLAGLLNYIQINHIKDLEVIVYNWGMETSRDRKYAERIANLFDWEYISFDNNPDLLRENIYENVKIGCEISPVNLHAMKRVRDSGKADIILAGSYGDTIGRGEYNGTRIDKAKEVILNPVNKRGIILNEVVSQYESNIKREQKSIYNHINPQFLFDHQRKEFEYHQSHTRRYLTTAMSLIAQKTPVYQLFTSPKVVSYIWSLPLSLRYDKLYWLLLNNLSKDLLEIPWARTGLKFFEDTGKPDNYTSNQHLYGKWLRSDLKEEISTLVNNPKITNLGIFNQELIEKNLELWSNNHSNSITSLDQWFSWMASFSVLLDKYEINNDERYNRKFSDRINSLKYSAANKVYLKLKQ